MTEAGFLAPKRISPTGLTLVIALHAAGLTAVLLTKGPEFVRQIYPRTVIHDVKLIDPPPADQKSVEKPKPAERPIFVERPIVAPPLEPVNFAETTQIMPPLGPIDPVGTTTMDPPRPPEGVRTEAEFDARFVDRLRPPYPLSEQRNEIEGKVTLRLLIGADGRVKAAEKIAATTDGFFKAAQRQALTQWRFRPATIDGKPIESRKQMTLRFELHS